MNKKEFIKRMEQKLTYGDCISNEDLMRGLLILLAEDDNVGKTEETKKSETFDAEAIGRAFFDANKTASDRETENSAKQLRTELSYIQYNEVISAISNLDENNYFIREIVNVMRRVSRAMKKKEA